MVNYFTFSFAIFIIIIIIMIYMITKIQIQSKIYNTLLSGFYNGDEKFCYESGIDTFCMYIDDNIESSSNTRGCYLLMKSGSDLILNEPIIIKLNQHWTFNNANSPVYFDVEFKNLDDNIKEFFPNKQQLRFYPTIGKIVLFSGDIIYGVFYKSGYESELKMIAEESNSLKKGESDEFEMIEDFE